jgi:hypothetical protein
MTDLGATPWCVYTCLIIADVTYRPRRETDCKNDGVN